ncbi:hypothetical protein BH11PSE2_BH11PSE2_05450 [soil metagenome]
MSKRVAGIMAVLACGGALAAFAGAQADTETVKADLKSAGALAFAPNGVLLVGDSIGGSVYAFDTGDRAKAGPGKVEIADLSAKIAAMLGTTADQIAINDVAVNPLSGNVYMSVSRGLGAQAAPVIIKADRAGKLSELSLSSTKHTLVSLIDAPAADNARNRQQTITDLGYVDGKVVIAGLSNEEFSSSLRAISYPFVKGTKGANIEIYHGSHGRYETNSPIRTFMSYNIDGKPQILAAYTCTPLVKIPVSELQPGAKVKGTTIAELGNVNQPLDMFAYTKDSKHYILMANSARGVMKLSADGLGAYPAMTAPVPTHAGVPFETIADLKDVKQLDKVDDTSAVVLIASAGTTSLRTIGLP